MAILKQGSERTIVRDPRKIAKRAPAVVPVAEGSQEQPPQRIPPPPLPFQPSQRNQESVGSTLASYMLAGVGETMGEVLVRVALGI